MPKLSYPPLQSYLTDATQRLGSRGLAWSMQTALATMNMRLAYYDPSVDGARKEYNEHCIYLIWHENVSALLVQWRLTPMTILISQHRDAKWLARVSDVFGYGIVRGSTTRGGAAAVRQLKQRSMRSSLGMTPDGPRGPRRKMALGPIYLASRLGMPIVPWGVGYDRPFRLKTWDRFAIPRIFSRCRVIMGPKIRVPRKASPGQLESYRLGTERLLNQLSDFAESWATSKQHMRGEQAFCRARRCQSLEFAARSGMSKTDNSNSRYAA